ncbi:Ff.00g114540.m01.CDS01 [Fusarium sp. VM40]|nr:Ff.00g114540.m01.CDS01 [Fusarium sp. VM40]
MPIYLSMQRVRFSSPDAYEKFKVHVLPVFEFTIADKFKVLFADTQRHLMTLPGFLHLTCTRLIRVCPVCNKAEDKKYNLAEEQAVLRETCPQCGFHFPVLDETPSSFAVFKDVPGLAMDNKEAKKEVAKE